VAYPQAGVKTTPEGQRPYKLLKELNVNYALGDGYAIEDGELALLKTQPSLMTPKKIVQLTFQCKKFFHTLPHLETIK
jgi:hypothetical protein